jgi:hypothetical protein
MMIGARIKIVHRAKHIRQDGAVSPLCAATPRVLNLRIASWTMRDDAVTCSKCKKLLAEKYLHCAQCRHIIESDDDAGVCIECGGRNKRAVFNV